MDEQDDNLDEQDDNLDGAQAVPLNATFNDVPFDSLSFSDIPFDALDEIERAGPKELSLSDKIAIFKELSLKDKIAIVWDLLKMKTGEYKYVAQKHVSRNKRKYICGATTAAIILLIYYFGHGGGGSGGVAMPIPN
jgi:hypothetical protein